MAKLPNITIVTPCHNGLPLLRETLASIAQLDYPQLETVLIDDASTDGSAQVAQAAGVRLITASGIGPAAARNLGIQASESEFLYFLDADDLPGSPGVLRKLVTVLQQNPDAGLAQGFIQNFESDENGRIYPFMRPYRFLNLGSFLWRRSLLERIGGFDESLRYCEDMDLLMRCWEQDVPKVVVESLVLYYRRHPAQMTAGLNGAQLGTLRAYKRRMERIQAGLYNPNQPRQVDWNDYVGKGPDNQDRRTA